MATTNNNTKSSNSSYSSNKGNSENYANFNQFQQIFHRQFESATAANQVALEGGQNIARCCSDAMQTQFRQGANLWRNSFSNGLNSPSDIQENFRDFSTHSIQNCYNTANNLMQTCTETATNLVSVYGEGLSNTSREIISAWGNLFALAAKNNFSPNAN